MALNIYLPSSTTSVAGPPELLGLTQIVALHARGVRGAGIRIGLVDSGVTTSCAGLAGAQITTLDRTGVVTTSGDAVGHGTSMAAIMVGAQIAICPDAAIVSVQAFTTVDTGYLAEGVAVALANNVDVISISGGQPAADPQLTAVVQRACDAGVPVVAAVDNVHPDVALYPACQPGTIAVAACTAQDALVHPGLPSWVALAALGVGVMTYDGDALVQRSGASEATAVVSAVCALLLGVVPPARRREAGKQLRDVLSATAAPSTNSSAPCHIVQPASALAEICKRFAVSLPAAVVV